jgi:predicted nucleic acid-binding protein
MIVLDTSAWIEMLVGSKTGSLIEQRRSDAGEIIVPTIVQQELAKWALREHSHQKAEDLIAHTNELRIVPLDTALAFSAATLSRDHKLHTTDAIIYATAQLHDAPLVTCDAHFKGLEGVEYFEK